MTDKKNMEKTEPLLYKGKPLVRSGNTIYYGYASDEYVALLQILESQMIHDVDTATKVSVQILSTDSQLDTKDRIKKKTEKNGLYSALNIASIWLERYLQGTDA